MKGRYPVKQALKRLLLMIQFLTTFPIRYDLRAQAVDYGKGLVYAPLIGLGIGFLLLAARAILGYRFSPLLTATGMVIFYIIFTGGLHLDGWSDTADGVFSNRPKERMLEIMKDSRVGTYAVLALVSLIILNILLLAEFTERMAPFILMMPVAGRMVLPVAAGIEQYARADGLAKSFVDYCGLPEAIGGTLVYLGISLVFLGWRWLGFAVLPVVFALLVVKWLARKIGGVTGDLLGAVCELTQTFYLLIAYLAIK